jgi:hemerythrin
MPVIEWSEDLSVGVPVLDGHHQRLLGLLNQLYEVIRRRDADDVIGHVLDALERYTVYHFAEEERLMEAAGYPDLAAHRNTHRILTGHVQQMMGEHRGNPGAFIAAELFEFLSDWLIHHIKSEDMAYREHLAGG